MPAPETHTARSRAPRPHLSQHFFLVAAAAVVGGVAALAAVLFRAAIRTVQDVTFVKVPAAWGLLQGAVATAAEDPLAYAAHLPAWWVLLAPAAGGCLAAPLIYLLAREAKGHGVPEVMEAVILRGGRIRPRVAVVKALASSFTIGTGGSVGREGPIVQIGSALGSTAGQLLRLPEWQLRTLVGAGAAAGIAAAFNAPIAGALFAAEVILGDFGVQQFSPIVIASVVATVISRTFLGDQPAFAVPEYSLVSPFELGPYVVVGLVAAGVGIAFIRALYACEDVFEGLPIPSAAKLPVGGLAVGAIGVLLPQVLGVGYSTIDAALRGELSAGLLLLLLPAKIAAASLTLGSGGSGGIFAPSLFLGAVTGGAFGTAVHALFPESTATSGAYALVTMGAVVAATTHAPITAGIILFELTQDVTIIPPLMAACVVSTAASSLLHPESIYTLKLRRRGIRLLWEQEPNVLKTLRVRDVLHRSPETVPASASFAEVIDLVVSTPSAACFVVDEKDRLLGAIDLSELRRLLGERDLLRDVVVAADLVQPVAAVREEDDLDLVMQFFAQTGLRELPVVGGDAGRLAGSVREQDVIVAYDRAMLRQDLAGGVTRKVVLAGRGQRVAVGSGFVLAELPVPAAFAGRSLRELDLRARFGVQVVLIRPAAPGDADVALRFPGPDERLQPGERMVVLGREEAVDRLESL